jgi:hypothetical protein
MGDDDSLGSEWPTAVRERRVADLVGPAETVRYRLSNEHVGISRLAEAETTIKPAEAGEAEAVITERRVLLGVTEPAGRPVEALTVVLRYADLAGIAAADETLAAAIDLETDAGPTWRFTAREHDRAISAVSFLDDIHSLWAEIAAARDDLEHHHVALQADLHREAWDGFDETYATALDRLERAREMAATADVADPDHGLSELAETIHRIAVERYHREAVACLETARDGAAPDELPELVDRATNALATADELVADQGLHGPAAEATDAGGPTLSEPRVLADLGPDVRERLREAAEAERERADSLSEASERIVALETALACFRAIHGLVERSLADSADRQALREAAEGVIAALYEARVATARDERATGNWDQQAGNEDAARPRFQTAYRQFSRALSLAQSYPVGDADAVADELADLESRLEALDIEVPAPEQALDD